MSYAGVVENLYEAIGLPVDAMTEEIEAACLRLGELYRPSPGSGDLETRLKFEEVERAYATLIDPATRAAYDKQLHEANSGSLARVAATTATGTSSVRLDKTNWLSRNRGR